MSLALAAGAASACPTDHINARVAAGYVIDGDTLKLADGRKVRLIGINAPELGDSVAPEPFAMEAQRALQDMIPPGSPLLLRFGAQRHDRHQRLLAHVFLEDGTNVQQWLVQKGLAAVIAVPPNLWAIDCYRQYEQRARGDNAGMWSMPRFKSQPVAELTGSSRGFYIISGRVTHVRSHDHLTQLQLDERITLQIDDSDLRYFEGLPLLGLRGHAIRARGWLYPYGKGLRMRVRHGTALEILD